jgi:hypothetical protein
MRKIMCSSLLLLAALADAPVLAGSPDTRPVAAAAAYSSASTALGTLLDNPRTRAILDRHIPGLSSDMRISMARTMTLKAIQGFSGGRITNAQLAAIDADLARLRR